jgi:hypothetical protein
MAKPSHDGRIHFKSTRPISPTPAGTFQHCLRIKETSAVESGTSEKVYAPGVGLIRDDEFVLTRYGKIL